MIVRELMTTHPVTVRGGTAVKAALSLLDDHDITSLPVVDAAGRIVGVASEADLATAVDFATSTGIKSLPMVDEDDAVVGMISRRDVVRMLARSDATLEQDTDELLVSTGMRDWLVDVHDGIAEISGPSDLHGRVLARVVVGSVPGVVEVRVDPTS